MKLTPHQRTTVSELLQAQKKVEKLGKEVKMAQNVIKARKQEMQRVFSNVNNQKLIVKLRGIGTYLVQRNGVTEKICCDPIVVV